MAMLCDDGTTPTRSNSSDTGWKSDEMLKYLHICPSQTILPSHFGSDDGGNYSTTFAPGSIMAHATSMTSSQKTYLYHQ